MYKTWKKAGVSLMAITALLFLAAPMASAEAKVPVKERVAWGIPTKDIIGENVRAKNSETVGSVEDMTITKTGRTKDVIVGLAGTSREVAVPMRDFRFNQNFVMYKGTKASLDRMATVAYVGPSETPVRGYYEGYQGGFYTQEPRHAFFRPESYFHPYNFNQPEYVYHAAPGYYAEQPQGAVHGYYSEQPESKFQNHGTAYWDTHLPRTPYMSAKRWLP